MTWLGLRSRQDWALVRRAVRDEYVLVTNDTADFTSLMAREPRHPGLICMNVAHGFMRLDVQAKLFEHALTRLADVDLAPGAEARGTPPQGVGTEPGWRGVGDLPERQPPYTLSRIPTPTAENGFGNGRVVDRPGRVLGRRSAARTVSHGGAAND